MPWCMTLYIGEGSRFAHTENIHEYSNWVRKYICL